MSHFKKRYGLQFVTYLPSPCKNGNLNIIIHESPKEIESRTESRTLLEFNRLAVKKYIYILFYSFKVIRNSVSAR